MKDNSRDSWSIFFTLFVQYVELVLGSLEKENNNKNGEHIDMVKWKQIWLEKNKYHNY